MPGWSAVSSQSSRPSPRRSCMTNDRWIWWPRCSSARTVEPKLRRAPGWRMENRIFMGRSGLHAGAADGAPHAALQPGRAFADASGELLEPAGDVPPGARHHVTRETSRDRVPPLRLQPLPDLEGIATDLLGLPRRPLPLLDVVAECRSRADAVHALRQRRQDPAKHTPRRR